MIDYALEKKKAQDELEKDMKAAQLKYQKKMEEIIKQEVQQMQDQARNNLK